MLKALKDVPQKKKRKQKKKEERRAEMDHHNELQRARNAAKKTPVSQNTRRDELKIKSQR